MDLVTFTNQKDFEHIKWDTNFVLVTYKDKFTEIKNTVSLKNYFEIFKDVPKEERPKIDKFVIQEVTENILVLLNHYNIKIKYNEFKMSYEVFCEDGIFKLEDYIRVIQDKATKNNLKLSKDNLLDFLVLIGKQNKYNPIKEYLVSCHDYYLKNPDNNIFKKLSDTVTSNSQFKDKYIGRFLLQMVYLACCDEDSQIAAQYLLVLQGKQGIGKTTWLQNLLPNKLKSKYFLGGKVLDMNNKDHIMETITNWLCEIGEISSTFKKSDQEALKNFITSFKDKFRLPYAKEATEQKRRTSLCGTTNDTEYLKDLTGTRRFLTLNCESFNFNHDIDIDMLWGYIYNLYLKKHKYWFDINEINEVIEDNKSSLSIPENILIIEEKFNLFPGIETDANEDAGIWLSGSQIFELLIVPTGCKMNKFNIGRELKKMNVNWKKDSHLKKDLFYVKRL